MMRRNNTPENIHYNSDEEPIVLSKHLMDTLLKQNNAGDCIALYTFYYYTAKWQKTNTPLATTEYTANGLKWAEDHVRKIKKILLSLNLIQDIIRRDNKGRVIKRFIQVNFIWSKVHTPIYPRMEKSPYSDLSEDGKIHSMEKPETNALSSGNINALNSNNKENALSSGNNLSHSRKKTIGKNIPPSLEEVKNYCLQKKIEIDIEKFYAYHEAGGWYRGKTKIRNWIACITTWKNNDDLYKIQKNNNSNTLSKYRKPSKPSNGYISPDSNDNYFSNSHVKNISNTKK